MEYRAETYSDAFKPDSVGWCVKQGDDTIADGTQVAQWRCLSQRY